MVEAKEEGPTGKITNISFNQDAACFAVSTDKGFKIFNSYPFKNNFQRDFDGGIAIVSMLYRSNILALVGMDSKSKFPPNKVILWDDHAMKVIGELNFKYPVKSVKLRKEKIVVALEQRVYIYQITDLKLLDAIDTYDNPNGVCALSSKDATILITPDKKKGYIKINNYDTNVNSEIKAHESNVTAVAISQDGKICATASDKGTLLRVFSIADGKLLTELRRGADKADIYSIAFDSSAQWLASTSDKGTVHIFSLSEANMKVYGGSSPEGSPSKESEKKTDAKNPKSGLSFLKGIIPYFNSEWSFAQFRIPDSKAVVAFGPAGKNCIIVASYDGNYYLAEFDPKAGGDCRKLEEKQISA